MDSSPAWAENPRETAEAREELRTVLFGGIDIGNSAFGSAGFKRAIGPSLDRNGFLLLGYAGFGGSREAQGASDGRGTAAQASLLAGYQWIVGRTVLAGFIGPEFDFDKPRRDIPGEARLGLRFQGEVWSHPTEDTLVTGTLIAGTARGHLWSRVAFGYKLVDTVFIGPETSLYRTDTYREWRLGLHATGISLGRFSLRVSAGYRQDDDDRRGAYVGLSAHSRM